MKTVVIKYGGHAMDHPDLAETFMRDLAEMIDTGMRFVVVHGGGPMINSLLKRLNIESHFVNGLRVTDEATLEVVEMALCGQVNKAVVRGLCRCGIRACGISGEDGALLHAEKKSPELGYVGSVKTVDPQILQSLLSGGFVPVVAPLALDATGHTLNVNADTAAGSIAGALGADHFVLISDVPGILDGDGRLYSYLTQDAIADLIKDGIITGGMIPKVEACLHALAEGSRNALIIDGRKPGSLRDCLLKNTASGTAIAR